MAQPPVNIDALQDSIREAAIAILNMNRAVGNQPPPGCGPTTSNVSSTSYPSMHQSWRPPIQGQANFTSTANQSRSNVHSETSTANPPHHHQPIQSGVALEQSTANIIPSSQLQNVSKEQVVAPLIATNKPQPVNKPKPQAPSQPPIVSKPAILTAPQPLVQEIQRSIGQLKQPNRLRTDSNISVGGGTRRHRVRRRRRTQRR
jgi:hypothetical protein